jgi:hypothetical protein
VANMGRFSSDRTVLGYARDVWNVYVPPVVKGVHQVPSISPKSGAGE